MPIKIILFHKSSFSLNFYTIQYYIVAILQKCVRKKDVAKQRKIKSINSLELKMATA